VTMIPMATAGPCYTNCQMVMPFMVLLFFMTLVVAVTQMPVLMVVLRAVSEEEKAFALGIQFVIFRLFGYIPSPILFGNVIDSTCLLWKSTCKGEEGGRCLMYDIEAFRYKYVGVCCGIKVLSVIIFCLDWYLIKRRENEEKKQKSMTVGEIVNSIISLDKLFDPEGPMWVPAADAEGNPTTNTDPGVDGISLAAAPGPSSSAAVATSPSNLPSSQAAPGIQGPVSTSVSKAPSTTSLETSTTTTTTIPGPMQSRADFSRHRFSKRGRRKSHAANVVVATSPSTTSNSSSMSAARI